MYDYEKNITKINLVSKRNKIDINGFVSELNENFSIIRPLNLTYKLSINEFKKIKFSVDGIDWYLVSDNSDELKYPNLFVHNWFVPYDGKIFLNFGNIKNLIYCDIKSHYFGCSFLFKKINTKQVMLRLIFSIREPNRIRLDQSPPIGNYNYKISITCQE